jgi:hypothetical protein
MSTRTLGPWSLGDDGLSVLAPNQWEPSRPELVVRIDDRSSGQSTDQNRVNAHLIAAAPAMLAVLKLAWDEIHHPGSAAADGIDIGKVISIAIAKAEGRK